MRARAALASPEARAVCSLPEMPAIADEDQVALHPMSGRRGQGMEPTDRVDLAHAPGFTLGHLSVRPALHQVVRDDGAEEVLQHRVMQVLVALARADGGIVTRDELTMSCWDGRVVGEDAINRILSRLRSVATGIGADSFRIETITRVGYRLLREGQRTQEIPAGAVDALPSSGRPGRRAFMLGGAMLAAAGGTGLFFLLRRPSGDAAVPPDVMALWNRAMAAQRQGTPESNDQAIGLMRQVVDRAPDFADAWGALAMAYAAAYWGRGARTGPDSAQRARAAIERARALDPDNANALSAEIGLLVVVGHWAEFERRVRAALRTHPHHFGLVMQLGWILQQVGRFRESVDPYLEAVALEPAAPLPRYMRALALWVANRLEEADRATRQDLDLFPTYGAIWFGRFDFLAVSGRIDEAIRLGEDRAGWPPGVPQAEFGDLLLIARALQSRTPAMIDAVMLTTLGKARRGTGFAEIAIKFASMFGRLDEAFAVADALFFGRGFDPGELRYSAEQAIHSPHRDRRTHFLFCPGTAAMRADPRFERLVTEIGLTRYWAETGTLPDYRRA